MESSIPEFDVLFGPAYKGIPLAAAAVIALSRDYGKDMKYAYNRKEKKDVSRFFYPVSAIIFPRPTPI